MLSLCSQGGRSRETPKSRFQSTIPGVPIFWRTFQPKSAGCRPFEAGHNGPTENVNSIRDNKVSSLEQGNYIQIRIGRHFIRALLDSGTHYSLISEKAAKRLHLTIQPVESSLNLFAAEGSAIGIIGSVDLDMVISGLHISHTAYVVNNLCNDQMLLGRSFMAETSMVMDFAQGIATIHSNLVPIKLINKNLKDFWQKQQNHYSYQRTLKRWFQFDVPSDSGIVMSFWSPTSIISTEQ